MDKSLDPFFQLNESAVVRNGYNFTFNKLVASNFFLDVFPRMLLQLLETQRDTLTIFVVIQNYDIQFLI